MDFYLGQITLWAIQFAPQGWALCDGSQLAIAQNQALYSLLGTTFGGNGSTTFNLPDLRNRVPMGSASVGQIGLKSGSATATQTATGAGQFTLTTNNLPAHNHPANFAQTSFTAPTVSVNAIAAAGPNATPAAGNYIAIPNDGSRDPVLYPAFAPSGTGGTVALGGVSSSGGSVAGTVAVGNTGLGQPVTVPVNVPVSVSTIQPSMTMNFFICIEGVYPTRP
ncbi:phage tail protein [Azospirillum sp. sgz302134]